MNRGFKMVENEELILERIPTKDSVISDIVGFGQNTFNGYAYHGSFAKCSEVASSVLSGENNRPTLIELRTALFQSLRQMRSEVHDCDHIEMEVRDLITKIRDKVEAKDFE